MAIPRTLLDELESYVGAIVSLYPGNAEAKKRSGGTGREEYRGGEDAGCKIAVEKFDPELCRS